MAAMQANLVIAPIHIGPAELADHRQSVWSPPYPDAAKSSGREATVKLRLVINELGNVTDVIVISGDPLFVAAALPVVRRWNYRPFERSGKRVAVTAEVAVRFDSPDRLSLYQEWRQHLDSARAYRRQGQDGQEEAEYKAAVTAAGNVGDQERADSLRDLAFFYFRRGDETQALPLLRERLHVLEKSRIQNPPEIAYARVDVAVVLARLKDFDTAEPLLRSTIPVLEKYKRATTLDYAKAAYDRGISMALFGLAIVLDSKGKGAEAEPLIKRAISLGKPVLAADDTALIMRSYAVMLQKAGRPEEASRMNGEATALQLDLASKPQ